MTAISDDLTDDAVLGGKLRLRQYANGYRVAMDTVLLAAAVPAASGSEVLELGAGNGGASLCLAVRVPGCRITGVERDADLLGLAQFNAGENNLAGRVSFVAGDVAALPHGIMRGGYDQVFSNPPFLQESRADARRPMNAQRRRALLESDVTLTQWVGAMLDCLKPKGRITLVHRADRLADILGAFTGRAGATVICPLWPRPGGAAKRIIVTARLGVATPLRLTAGLTLHGPDGAYTPAMSAILEQAAPLPLDIGPGAHPALDASPPAPPN